MALYVSSYVTCCLNPSFQPPFNTFMFVMSAPTHQVHSNIEDREKKGFGYSFIKSFAEMDLVYGSVHGPFYDPVDDDDTFVNHVTFDDGMAIGDVDIENYEIPILYDLARCLLCGFRFKNGDDYITGLFAAMPQICLWTKR